MRRPSIVNVDLDARQGLAGLQDRRAAPYWQETDFFFPESYGRGRFELEAVFVAGAILPAVLAVAIWLLMPESPKFLARRAARSAELASMLNRLVREARYSANDRFIIDEPAAGRGEGNRRSSSGDREPVMGQVMNEP